MPVPMAWTAQVIPDQPASGWSIGEVLPAPRARPRPALPSRPWTPRTRLSESGLISPTPRRRAAIRPESSTSSGQPEARRPTSTWHCSSVIPRTKGIIPTSGLSDRATSTIATTRQSHLIQETSSPFRGPTHNGFPRAWAPCVRVDSSNCGGSPVSCPYPELLMRKSDTGWGELAARVVQYGFTSIGPVDTTGNPLDVQPVLPQGHRAIHGHARRSDHDHTRSRNSRGLYILGRRHGPPDGWA